MRHSVHCLLVGVLVLAPAIDAAQACGHLRHWHPCAPTGTVSVVIVADGDLGSCWPLEPACVVHCGWCDPPVATTAGDSACLEEIPCGASLDASGESAVVFASPVVTAEQAASGGVVSEAGPTLAPAPRPAEPVPAPEPLHAVPALEPVAPASVSEPGATDPQPDSSLPEPAVEEPAPEPSAPAPRNVFEEADESAAVPAQDGLGPVAEFVPAAQRAAEPAATPRAAQEPLRRWIDDTATYAVVGRLVDVRVDRVDILRADGRSVTVPVARLSGLDRRYVAGALVRIAAARPAAPGPTDSAGR